jgi:hypothetical protein
LKQSETKDQTEKDVKIKRSNYNFSEGLITNCKKFNDPIRSIHLNFEIAPFLGALFIVFLKANDWAVKVGEMF